MNHETVLNLLLSAACPKVDSDGWAEYRVDLHCRSYRIRARLIASPPMWEGESDPPESWRQAFKYEISGMEKV